MLTIKNVKNLQGQIETHTFESHIDKEIDVQGKLTMIPALIDPHVHFRTPGSEHKEDWKTAAQAAIAGGITTVFDMPNNHPPCIDVESLIAKKKLIDAQLSDIKIPLRYHLLLGAEENHLEGIGKCQEGIIGVKVYMGSSTGGLTMENEAALDRIFQLGAIYNLIITVHAEDEEVLKKNQKQFAGITDPSIHSKIRDRMAAIKALEKAISLAEKYTTQLYIAHVSTKEEVDLIRVAKKNGLLIYAEATPHHLFLTEEDYAKWGTKVQMNPPLRTKWDVEALWAGIHDSTIDTIGSDHAPHTLEEKSLPYGKSPSGVPGLETTLPLLLNAYHEKKIALEQIVALTRTNIELIYDLERQNDVVLVDLELTKIVKDENLKTKCGWSPFSGLTLKGWPIYTVLRGELYHV